MESGFAPYPADMGRAHGISRGRGLPLMHMHMHLAAAGGRPHFGINLEG